MKTTIKYKWIDLGLFDNVLQAKRTRDRLYTYSSYSIQPENDKQRLTVKVLQKVKSNQK